jgi:hypothetical protein
MSRLLLTIALIFGTTSCAVLDDLARTSQPGTQPSEARIAEGLREALRVGSSRASDRVGRLDGYLGNELIKIALPDSVQQAAVQLRRVGLGRQVDELELAMNRAAESAAREAVDVFADAIGRMRPTDVYAVFRGDEDAATRYLRTTSESVLRERYQPIVGEHLERVQGMALYREIATTWNRLPRVQPLDVDLDRHVTEQALDGLFLVLAEEERRIRTDPAARTTRLLREVFSD